MSTPSPSVPAGDLTAELIKIWTNHLIDVEFPRLFMVLVDECPVMNLAVGMVSNCSTAVATCSESGKSTTCLVAVFERVGPPRSESATGRPFWRCASDKALVSAKRSMTRSTARSHADHCSPHQDRWLGGTPRPRGSLASGERTRGRAWPSSRRSSRPPWHRTSNPDPPRAKQKRAIDIPSEAWACFDHCGRAMFWSTDLMVETNRRFRRA